MRTYQLTKVTILILITISLGLAIEEHTSDFIIQLTPAVDGKKVKPYNISLNINSSLSHNISVSNTNYRKNITLDMQLFAWYNGGWISKKSRLLQLTDRKTLISNRERMMLRQMKARFMKSVITKLPVVLRKNNIYVSYDPEGSFMTSDLEDPNLFTPSSNYLLIDTINKNLDKIDVELTFKIMHKTQAFIENRRHLSELAEIKQKVEEVIPLISKPFDIKTVEPIQILDWVRRNIQTLGGQQKNIEEKLTLMQKYKLKALIAPGIKKFNISQECPLIDSQIKQYKLTYKDSAIFSYKWIFQQQEMKERIDTLKERLLAYPSHLVIKDLLVELSDKAEMANNMSCWVLGLWVIVDLASLWFIKKNVGLSRSYGTCLNILILIEIVGWSVKIGFSLHLYAGITVFLTGLIIHWAIVRVFERRFDANIHLGSHFDTLITSFVKNLLITVFLFGIVLHCYMGLGITSTSFMKEGFQVLKKSKASLMVTSIWAFSEFTVLLNEYFFVLAILPQILLNFRLRSVEKGAFLRVIILLIVMYSNWDKNLINYDQFLNIKQGLLGLALMTQIYAYRNSSKVQTIMIQLQEDQEVKDQKKQDQIVKQQKIKVEKKQGKR